MLDLLGNVEVDTVALAAILLVSTLVIARFYTGSVLLDIKYLEFWGTARQLFMPLIDKLAKRLVGISAENSAHETEHVADICNSPREIADMIQANSKREFEVSVLSGLKRDPINRKEIASIVGYMGARPWPNSPEWLRAKQVHIFMFDVGDYTRLYAHVEANSWRPDLWKDHLFKGESFNAEQGVRITKAWLDTEN